MFVELVGEALGTDIVGYRLIKSGDLHDAYKLQMADGRIVFAKTNRAERDAKFAAEAAGLEWLGKANATPVPEVLIVNEDIPGFLILEWIEEGRGSSEDEANLGRSLARMHTSGAPGYGREDGLKTGRWNLPNELCRSWGEFFASQRLIPLARVASDADALSRKAVAGIERVADRIDILVGPKEPPARLHGDLWAGNRLVDSSGQSWLIDPKSFGGDREFDLATMRLFGGFSDACFDAYDELFPLADGWAHRLPLYQLAPLISQAIKSGGHYVGRVDQALLQLR